MTFFYSILILILILLLGILLAPFLGGNRLEGMTDMSFNSISSSSSTSTSTSKSNIQPSSPSSSYDNYNHYTGSSNPTISSSTFYGSNGSTLAVNMNGTNTLTTTDHNGNSIIYTGIPSFDGTINTYQGPQGSVAVVVTINSKEHILIKDSNGNEVAYSPTPTPTTSTPVLPNVTPSSTPSSLLPPTNPNPNQNSGMNWFSSPPSSIPSNSTPILPAYQAMNTSSTAPKIGPSSQGSYPSLYPNNPLSAGSTSTYNPNSGYNYASSLPPGIPASQIPRGQEDKYILKSEIVPPVCPVCPIQTTQTKCPPCPACERCPEPSYNCKLVPNYAAMNANSPVPVLNDFSSFGM
jgi:hypothetical protein